MTGPQPPVLEAPLPGGSKGAEVPVHPLLTAEAPAGEVYFERPRGRLAMARGFAQLLRTPKAERLDLPLPAFLVEHPTAGLFMIDTGVSPLHAQQRAQDDVGRAAATLFSARMRPDQAAGEQVRALGHDPPAIGLVVMTHLHWDHLGGAEQFPGAEFLAARAEWADPPSMTKGTVPRHREAVRRWRLLDDAAPSEPHRGLSRTWDLFGDGSVRLAWTPGHSPGHLSVVLRLRGGRPCLLTADAAYTRDTIEARQVPLLCPDVPTYLRSLDELRAYVAQAPDALVLAGHDPYRWAEDSVAIEKA